ncbi:DUF308 domain-containing protein [Pseudofrankia inefficax]|uniref:Uncharacterized protein n=1 Tax=Pseudofrankia inefficax (strain DSM 45817 / CECT 9037 / DDB 130130 / EuI1c) TaxID=298654 RepID=E3JBK1_PSEI1|nr:DUF308 domain-containing protein [Pseudofrankia inefficax]ADP79873.1 hypothetical protein FraEuI1c_1817 [Pseudofrankia inefficax]
MSDPSDPRPADGSADQPADDDVFAELVAHFHDEPAASVWPDAENVGRAAEPPDGPTGDADEAGDDGDAGDASGDGGPRAGTDRDRLDEAIGRTLFVVGPPPAAGTSGGGAVSEEDDHYVPPPPPRAPWPRPLTWVAVAAIVLGVVVLAVPALVAQATSSTTQEVLGVLLILGGVGGLVARMGERPPTDDDNWPDDGAVL